MTTLTQAEALLHRASANASPFRVVIVATANHGGNPFPCDWSPKRSYTVMHAVWFKGELHALARAQGSVAHSTKISARDAANRIARAEGVYHAAGLWSNWGTQHLVRHRNG